MRVLEEPRDVDQVEVARALRILHRPGDVVEVRALEVTRSHRTHNIVSGYFDDFELAAAAAARLSGAAIGVYTPLNRVNPALLARRANRVDVAGKGETTSDGDILSRRWLLLDIDARRPTKISATDAEVAAAVDLRDHIVCELCAAGWTEPVLADSGNGAHALWPILLASDDGGLSERVLKGLAARYNAGDVRVDTTVHNPSRITKLYGTLARKGDQTADRPWRWSRITEAPSVLIPVPEEVLARWAEPPAARRSTPPGSSSWPPSGSFDPHEFVARHLQVVTDWRDDPKTGGEMAEVVCPFNEAHAGGEAAVGVMPSGAPWFKCHHDSCETHKWTHVRDLFEPDRPRAQAPRDEARKPPPRREEAGGQTQAPKPGTFAHDVAQALVDVKAALGTAKSDEREPLFGPAGDLFLRDFPATSWLVHGLITRGGVVMVGAEPKSGKTWSLAEIALAVATGTSAWGEFSAEPGQVAYFFAEDLAVQVRNRLRALLATRELGPAALRRLHVCPRGRFLDVTKDEDLAWIVASVRRLGSVDLLVLDPLRDVSSAAEDKSDEMGPVMRRLRLLGELLGCTVAVAHHAGKASADTAKRRPGQRMRGSSAIHGATDSGIYLGLRGGDGVGRFELDVDSEIKGARSAGGFELELLVEDDLDGAAVRASWTVSRGGREERVQKQDEGRVKVAELAIAEYLSQSTTAKSRGELQKELGLRRLEVLAAARNLVGRGVVVEVRGRRVGGAFPLWTRDQAEKAKVDIVPPSVSQNTTAGAS